MNGIKNIEKKHLESIMFLTESYMTGQVWQERASAAIKVSMKIQLFEGPGLLFRH